jgi:hypothetical protein
MKVMWMRSTTYKVTLSIPERSKAEAG